MFDKNGIRMLKGQRNRRNNTQRLRERTIVDAKELRPGFVFNNSKSWNLFKF